MVLIPIKITYNGKDETVEFEDSLTFGETESLISGSVDLTDVTKPKIDFIVVDLPEPFGPIITTSSLF